MPFFSSAFGPLVSYKHLFGGASQSSMPAVDGAGCEQGCSTGALGVSEGGGAGVLLDGTLGGLRGQPK